MEDLNFLLLQDILVTAVYLACKTEEFNVSMQQFVGNIAGNQERATQIILNNELLLMQELHFHLTIHNPYRAVEGLLIDIKTRAALPQGVSAGDVEQFRPEIDSFLDKVFLTDGFLIYAPSQIALAAVIHAASKNKINLDSYVTQQLFDSQGQEAITHIVTIVRNIRVLVKNIPEPAPEKDKELIKALCLKVFRYQSFPYIYLYNINICRWTSAETKRTTPTARHTRENWKQWWMRMRCLQRSEAKRPELRTSLASKCYPLLCPRIVFSDMFCWNL